MIYNKRKEGFILAIKVKKFNDNLRGVCLNLPNKEKVLKDRLIMDSVTLLEYVYMANFSKDSRDKMVILTKISMIDYYLEIFYKNKYFGEKVLYNLSSSLEEISKMVYGWVLNGS